MDVPNTSLYVPGWAAAPDALSSHVTTKCVTSSSTSVDYNFPLNVYAATPSSTRAAAYHKRGCVRVGTYWRQEVTYSFGDYGNVRLMPSSMSNLETLPWIPTRMIQCISSWIVGGSKESISTVSTDISNGKFFLFVISIYGILGKEALVVLANLSRVMAEKMDELISHVWGWINGRLPITVERSYYRMIRGSRLPSPLRDREPTGTQNRASSWRNKLHVGIIPHAHPQTIICHPREPSLPPLVCAPHALSPWPRTETIYGGRRRKYIDVKSRYLGI